MFQMRVVLAALALGLSFALPALASSPTIGSETHAGYQGGSTSGNVTQTCSAGDLVFMAVYSERVTTPSNVTTVSGGGLTWVLVYRSAYPQGAASPPGTTSVFGDAEVWYAKAPSGISGATLTVSTDHASDATEFSSFCVSGANATTPLDPDASLPQVNQNSTSSSVTYSTTNANDLLLAFRMQSNTTAEAAPTGFTSLVRAVNGSGSSRYSTVEVDYKSVSATQSSVTTNSALSGEYPSLIMIAATADASGGGGGGGASAGSLGLRNVGH